MPWKWKCFDGGDGSPRGAVEKMITFLNRKGIKNFSFSIVGENRGNGSPDAWLVYVEPPAKAPRKKKV